MKKLTLIFGLLLITTILTICHMGRSNYMTEEQRQQHESAYYFLQTSCKSMMTEYQASPDSVPTNP